LVVVAAVADTSVEAVVDTFAVEAVVHIPVAVAVADTLAVVHIPVAVAVADTLAVEAVVHTSVVVVDTLAVEAAVHTSVVVVVVADTSVVGH
jgi:hypothetical protein